jgi:hypothetical protein
VAFDKTGPISSEKVAGMAQTDDVFDAGSLILGRTETKVSTRQALSRGGLSVPEIRRLLEIALPLPERSIEQKWEWSLRVSQRA